MSRFLFYIEPYPIRNTFVAFDNVINSNFSGSLLNNKTEHEYFIYANKPTLEHIAQHDEEYVRHFIVPTDAESDLFKQSMLTWDCEGIEAWQGLMRPSALSDKYREVIKGIHARQPFDYIVCWGSNHAVVSAAKELNVGCINMELGCCREPYFDSLAIDPWGANGSSSLSQASIGDLADVEPSDAECDLLFTKGLESSGYESQFQYLNNTAILNRLGKGKIACLSLQLYDDANLLQYSSYNTVEDVVMDVLPSLAEHGYTCIIKEHPASAIRRGSNFANLKAKVYALGFDNVIWLTAQDTPVSNSALFRLSDVIVTTNSSVGFEALFFNKPVVVLGEAVYKVAGVFPSLREYLSGDFNQEKYLHNINKLRNFFLKYYLYPKKDAACSTKFFPFLKMVGDLSKSSLPTKEIVSAYIRHRSPQA